MPRKPLLKKTIGSLGPVLDVRREDSEHDDGVVAGRPVERDRDAEFVATGTVAELVAGVRSAREQLALDLATLDPTAPPRGALDAEDVALPLGRTQTGVALHVYEELVQHLGQLQLTRDLLLATEGSR